MGDLQFLSFGISKRLQFVSLPSTDNKLQRMC